MACGGEVHSDGIDRQRKRTVFFVATSATHCHWVTLVAQNYIDVILMSLCVTRTRRVHGYASKAGLLSAQGTKILGGQCTEASGVFRGQSKGQVSSLPEPPLVAWAVREPR